MKEIFQVMSAAIGQEMRMSQIANNLANVNTAGFKQDGSVFVDELQARLLEGQNAGQTAPAFPTSTVWPSMPRTYSDMSEGPLQQTGRDLDLAIESDGFFQIRGADGKTCYSRAGNFRIDDKGTLLTASGQTVLDSNGRDIAVNTTAGSPTFTPDGRVMSGGIEVGRLGIVKFDDPTQLVKRGEDLFEAPDGIKTETMDDPRVRQGSLEGSNVNAIDEMVRMIQVQRMYEAQQKVVQTFDELAGKRIESMQ